MMSNENKLSASNSWLIWLVVLGFFVVAVAWAFIPAKPGEKISLNSSSSKALKIPVNEPGEGVDYKEFMAEGKTNIVYFYADW